MELLVILALILPTFFLWSYLHEKSHIWAADILVGVNKYEMHLIPSIRDGNFYWAYVEYWTTRKPTVKEMQKIALAPRIPALLGLVLLPVSTMLGPWPALILSVFCLGGVLDFFVASLGITDTSDLKKAFGGFTKLLWILRIGGILLSTSAVLFWLFLGGWPF